MHSYAKKNILIMSLLFSSWSWAEDSVIPPSAAPSTNAPATTPTAVQVSPNITLAPSGKDTENADKLFKDATYENFTPQTEQPFIDSNYLNNQE